MSSTSSVITIKQALKAQLQAAIGATPTVYYSHPGAELGVEVIYLGDAREGEHEIPTLKAGRKRREESYVIPVVFEIAKPGTDASEAETRAFALFAYLENLLANTPGLGSADATLRTRVRGWTSSCTFTESTRGWRCQLIVDMLVENRLT